MEEDIIDKLELLIMETKESAFPTYWSKENAELVENLIKGYKELEEKNQDLICNYDNMAEQKEELEQKINYIDAEKELLVAQLKEEKLYGNKVTLELKGDNLPDILTKDYIPKSKVKAKIEELDNIESDYSKKIIEAPTGLVTGVVQYAFKELLQKGDTNETKM